MKRDNDFMGLSDKALAKVLKDYADDRKGEISEICYAASVRIGVLSAGIRRFREEEEGDDDLR